MKKRPRGWGREKCIEKGEGVLEEDMAKKH
jgi:hypothetical protein